VVGWRLYAHFAHDTLPRLSGAAFGTHRPARYGQSDRVRRRRHPSTDRRRQTRTTLVKRYAIACGARQTTGVLVESSKAAPLPNQIVPVAAKTLVLSPPFSPPQHGASSNQHRTCVYNLPNFLNDFKGTRHHIEQYEKLVSLPN
jgi:hypothetical protein